MIKKLKAYWFEFALSLAGLFVIAIGVGNVLLGAHLGASEQRAQIGDYVGGTSTPILTALTFIGVLVGVALQRRELIATRSELQLTRRETANSAKALKEQAEAIKVQNFERTLFESLSFLATISDNLEASYGQDTYKGRRAFSVYYNYGRNHFSREVFNADDELNSFLQNSNLQEGMKRSRYQLAPYYRTLYNIYRYLDESEFSDRKFYSRIIRVQLDDSFLALLFYNSLTEVGVNFQAYIAKYRVLDNLRIDMIIHPSHQILLDKMKLMPSED